jgi:hypothetical protein
LTAYGGKVTVYEFRGTDMNGTPAPTSDFLSDRVDTSRFNWIDVNYPASPYPMSVSINTGVKMGIDLINKTPGRFVLVGTSQGAIVASNIYDELRAGSLQSRRQDLIQACAFVNPRRQSGHSFPGCYEPGGRGSYEPNLADCEPLWWEFPIPGDPASSWVDDGSLLATAGRAVLTAIVNTFFGNILDLLRRFPNPLVDILSIIESLLEILYGISTAHQTTGVYAPMNAFDSDGTMFPYLLPFRLGPHPTSDTRSCLQVAIDQINSLAVADADTTVGGAAVAVTVGGTIPATTRKANYEVTGTAIASRQPIAPSELKPADPAPFPPPYWPPFNAASRVSPARAARVG